ncbi:MAG: RluA family pseudouridine synthase [Treponema sp.]|nr:RluA family pseudouridine synthase [Treponema sp.]
MKQPGGKAFFTIVYQDDSLAALNKSAHIAVRADRWDDSKERLDQLAEAALGVPKLYMVHRIDKDTSGLILFAKDSGTHKIFSLMFEERLIHKRYIAAVQGRPSWKETSCDLPLVPNGNKQHLTIIDKFRGKASLTAFRLLGSAGNYSIIEARPHTGRTHQIRVHLAALGHPVICDDLYGRSSKPVKLSSFKRNWQGDPAEERPLISRLGLHAMDLFIPGYTPPGVYVPGDSALEGLHLRAPLPRDLGALVKQMEKASGSSIIELIENLSP